jgi:TRAP-type uncharacterized transport system fused permease subunit
MLVDPVQMTGFLLTAHMIVFWLSQDSNVTPPVCLAAFTAAGIAGSKPMATGVEAWKIAKGLYIVPLMFAYTPLIGAPFLDLLRLGFFALFGIYAVNALVQRYSEGPLALWHYPILVIGAAGAFYPLVWSYNIAGAVLVFLVLWHSQLHKEPVAAAV